MAKTAPKKPAKPAAKASPKKPAPKKPEAKKPEAKKLEPKKPEAKKAEPKKLAKPTPAKVDAKTAKKPLPKAPEAKKPDAKKPEGKKIDPKQADAKGVKTAIKVEAKPAKGAPVSLAKKTEPLQLAKTDGAKTGPTADAGKRNTSVVNPKMVKKKPSVAPVMPMGLGRLLDSKRKPLIPSGPKATNQRPLGQHGGYAPDAPAIEPTKTTLGKKEIEHYRSLLLKKRAEILADVLNMETEALQGGSGSLSNMPSHLAEQGTEAFDQALSLDLAAAERKIVKEINDALRRIDAGTYGMCELTGKVIGPDRLEELPWARHTIQAAMELERQAMRPA
jgi:RNA polymerase-binding transcription factor DksA